MSMLFKRIKDWATSITAFRTGDVIPVDGPSGTAKMTKDALLRLTAQNASSLAIAPLFDATRTSENPYTIGEEVVYLDGLVYRFKRNHYGQWNINDVQYERISTTLEKAFLNFAKKFNNEKIYHLNDTIISWNGTLNRFVKEHTTGEVSSSEVVGCSISDVISFLKIPSFKFGYTTTNGSVVGQLTASDSYITATIYGAVGDSIIVGGAGTNTARLWATFSKDGYILRRADANTDAVSSPITITLQDGEVGVVFNSSYTRSLANDYRFYVNLTIADVFSILSGRTNECKNDLNRNIKETLVTGYIQNDVTSVQPVTSNSGWKCCVVYGTSGDVIQCTGKGGNAARLWATFDDEGKYTRRADVNASSLSTPVDVTLQPNEIGLVFNSEFAATSSTYVNVGVTKLSTIEERLQKSEKKFTIYNGENIIHKPNGFSGVVQFPGSRCFNVRAKFVLKGNPFNYALSENLKLVEFGCGDWSVSSSARAVEMSQVTTTFDDGGVTKTAYHPYFNGGVRINGSGTTGNMPNKNVGNIAFSIRYIGDGNSASFESTASRIILSKGGVDSFYDYEDYDSMGELFEALKLDSDFEVVCYNLEGMLPSDLALYSETQLISEYKKDLGSGLEVVTDNPAIFVRYGTADRIHQLEYFRDGGLIRFCVDGIFFNAGAGYLQPDKDIVLSFFGDHADFFDIEICTNSARGASVQSYCGVKDKVVSSVNPNIIVFEGHGVVNIPSDEFDTSYDEMDVTTDRLQSVFSLLKEKNYVPITMDDIIQYLNGNMVIPERCYTIIFDDFRFDIALDLEKRKAFTKNGALVNIAVISGISDQLYIDGTPITMKDAVQVCANAGVHTLSHTRNHRYMNRLKYSQYKSEVEADVYDGDIHGIDPNVIVYPYGAWDRYLNDVMEAVGLKGGVITEVRTTAIEKTITKYCIPRIEIGMRATLQSIVDAMI